MTGISPEQEAFDDIAQTVVKLHPALPAYEPQLWKSVIVATASIIDKRRGDGDTNRFSNEIAYLLSDPTKMWERYVGGGPWAGATPQANRLGDLLHILLAHAAARVRDPATSYNCANRQLRSYNENRRYDSSVEGVLERVCVVLSLWARSLSLRAAGRWRESCEDMRRAWQEATGQRADEGPERRQSGWWDEKGDDWYDQDSGRRYHRSDWRYDEDSGNWYIKPHWGYKPDAHSPAPGYADWWEDDLISAELLAFIEIEMSHAVLVWHPQLPWDERVKLAYAHLARAECIVVEQRLRQPYLMGALLALKLMFAPDRDSRIDRASEILTTAVKLNAYLYVLSGVNDVVGTFKAHKQQWPDAFKTLEPEFIRRFLYHSAVIKKVLDNKETWGRFALSLWPHLLSAGFTALARGEFGPLTELLVTWLVRCADWRDTSPTSDEVEVLDDIGAFCVGQFVSERPESQDYLRVTRDFLQFLREKRLHKKVPKTCRAVKDWKVPTRDELKEVYDQVQSLCRELADSARR